LVRLTVSPCPGRRDSNEADNTATLSAQLATPAPPPAGLTTWQYALIAGAAGLLAYAAINGLLLLYVQCSARRWQTTVVRGPHTA
jgi:hypothetical protein